MKPTNDEIIRDLWLNETVQSKKANLVKMFSEILNIQRGACMHRLTGCSTTNDAEFLSIIQIFERNGINTSKYKYHIQERKYKYGLYDAIEFSE